MLVPETCDEKGAWVPGTVRCSFVCSNGACGGACTPGSKQCNGQVPQTCSATGEWTGSSACPNVGDKPGACTGAGVCAAGLCPSGTRDCGSKPVPGLLHPVLQQRHVPQRQQLPQAAKCEVDCVVRSCGTNNDCTFGMIQCPANQCVQMSRNQCGTRGEQVGSCSNGACV
jgi:hypothetical protein